MSYIPYEQKRAILEENRRKYRVANDCWQVYPTFSMRLCASVVTDDNEPIIEKTFAITDENFQKAKEWARNRAIKKFGIDAVMKAEAAWKN